MAGISQGLYNTFIRSNAAFLATIFTGAFAFQMYAYPYLERAPPMVKTYGVARAFNLGSDAVWDSVNRGRQWKDIKHKYLQSAEAEDDDDDE
ncbi:hypothetical protein EV356DRAFT_534138 [Viridothelium virens]|uniref:Complex III subunit 9 n=1 Tax=Viridothelium virens TaxID=1048519 RepID=A0A6A6H5E9_VIRVR|nr:hypothetical protein EV356DRAFT_534138 [Viridothelium virens]